MGHPVHKSQVNHLLERIGKHEYFSQSIPPLDAECLARFIHNYGYDIVRFELNNMNEWLYADPENNRRDNWRLTLYTFLKNGNLHVCPKCKHRFKG